MLDLCCRARIVDQRSVSYERKVRTRLAPLSRMWDDAAPMSETLESNLHHVVLAGRYELSGVVGIGGMGSVYRARDRELDEVIAVKVLRRELIAQPDILERFRREVKLARRVTHTNVARVFDIGEHAGEKFITMEFVDGESLGARLARDGALPLADAVAIGIALGEGLAAAHAAGVVHRDLKPDNVLIASDGRVVVTDFGIARAMSVVEQGNRTAGLVIGTPQYMAPEQVRGAAIDARTDIYAWGLVLYEMLTGQEAWGGDSAIAIATARLVNPAPDARTARPEIPAPLAELLLAMLARAPEERPDSARNVIRALAAVPLQDGSSRPRPPSIRSPALGPRQVQRIAVVPLSCEGDEAVCATAFGISELIAEALDGRSGVDVRARGARLLSMAGRDLTAIGAELDVPLVIGGRLEGGSARMALVNARDGFVLWSQIFPSALRDPFGAAYDAVRLIAETLLLPPEAPPARPPADPRTVELLLRARFDVARPSIDGADRAVARLETAFSHAPNDPWVNAAYAFALAQRLGDTEFPGDAEDALAMAVTAVERAPRLAASHHALAEILLDRGELVAAARSAALARALAPGNPAVERIVAHLYVEAGVLPAAMAVLRSASTRDIPPWRAIWDEVRVLTAQGRWQDADEHLDAASDSDPLAAGPWVGRVRCALLRHDLVRCEVLRTQLAEVLARDKEPVLAALDAVLGRAPLPAVLQCIADYADDPTCSRQRAGALRQLGVDVAGSSSNAPRDTELLLSLSKNGLVDLTWLETSPTLDGLRGTTIFAEVLNASALRAHAIRAALAGPHETVAGELR